MRRMLFEKTGTAIWMSHLDTMRLMQRAFRRAGVILHHSQGFTPHAYVSMLLPLSVGVESVCEIMEYELDTDLRLTPEEMNAVLPEGVRVLRVYESTRKARELTYLQAELTLMYDAGVPENAVKRIAECLSAKELLVEKSTKRGMEETDIRPMLKSCEIVAGKQELRLNCVVCAQNPALNPMLLVSAIERYAPEAAPDFTKCRRVEVLDADGNVFR